MYLPTKDALQKISEKDLFDDNYVIFSDFIYKGIYCGTHLNCIDKINNSMQFK